MLSQSKCYTMKKKYSCSIGLVVFPVFFSWNFGDKNYVAIYPFQLFFVNKLLITGSQCNEMCMDTHSSQLSSVLLLEKRRDHMNLDSSYCPINFKMQYVSR